jgi:hypothetical protein
MARFEIDGLRDEFMLDNARVIACEDSGSFCIFGTMTGRDAKSASFGGNVDWIVTIQEATSAHGTEPTDSEPKASSTNEDGRSQEAADGGKAVMEGKE